MTPGFVSFARSRNPCYDHAMKKRVHAAACPQQYLTAFGLDPDRVIYFDIETTGFRASTSSLYMIGWAVRAGSLGGSAGISPDAASSGGPVPSPDAVFPGRPAPSPDDNWEITQVMAQSRSEEEALLKDFSGVLSGYDWMVAFNGERFDLPYLREKFEAHGMEDPFSRLKIVDLYQMVRPCRQMLGLERLSQKSVERFLQIRREDPYNGGELIDVYRSVRDHRCTGDEEENALRALFLHNYEDVLGMLHMTPLLSYRMASECTASVSIFPAQSHTLEAAFRLTVPVPEAVRFVPQEQCSVSLSGDEAAVTVRMLSGCLYHFFPDYQNYYYLPAEDTAMHKSVASFVDPSHRERAKAHNCYVRKEGLFLPLPKELPDDSLPLFGPLFGRFYKDPVRWFEYRPGMEDDTGMFSVYIRSFLPAPAGPRAARPEE